MTGQNLQSVKDAFALPKGVLFVRESIRQRGMVPGVQPVPFDASHIRWAFALYQRSGVSKVFSTQSELLRHVIGEHPIRAFWKGFQGWYDPQYDKKKSDAYYTYNPTIPPQPPKEPAGISSPRREDACGNCGTCC